MNPYQSHKPASGSGGLYLKLEDGETKAIRLASVPYIFQNEYQGKWSTRYAWVVFNHDDDVAQVLQLSTTTYRDIAALAMDEDYGDPAQYNIKLKRNGTGTDTTYSVIASPKKEALTAEQKAKVDKIDMSQVKGLEHALPLDQVTDGSNAPKPREDSTAAPVTEQPPASNYDEAAVDLDSIPF